VRLAAACHSPRTAVVLKPDPNPDAAMPRLHLLPTLTAAVLLLAGCDPPMTTLSPEPQPLLDAPTQVHVDGHDLTLEAHLWRDFKPISPPDGKPLVAVLRVKTADGRAFPAGVTADQVSVVFGDEVWTAPARQEHPSWHPGVLEVVARDGPRWGPGVTVDVVVRLRGSGGSEFRLGAPDQLIGRTD
jgi:hypothetical protein